MVEFEGADFIKDQHATLFKDLLSLEESLFPARTPYEIVNITLSRLL